MLIFLRPKDISENLKLPNYVLVPVTQIRMFRRIVKSSYKVRLYIGNGIYRKLRPIWVEIDLRNFERTHQHEPTDDHLEQDTNQKNDYGYHYGFILATGQTPVLQQPRPIYQKSLEAIGKDQVSDL